MAILSRIASFVKKKPLILDSFIFGSFYTSAEFLQQSYNTRNQILEEENKAQLDYESSPNPAFITGSNARRLQTSISETLSWTSSMLEGYNWAVLQRYVVYGYFIAGPILHGWYLWLDKFYKGTATKTIFKKLICDQFLLTPPLIVIFFTSMSLMEGKKNLFHECKDKFVKTFQTSCVYWIPVQFVNFWIIPPRFRVLFVSVACFCWVNILCHLKRAPLSVEAPEDT